MNSLPKIISLIAILITVLPCLLFFYGAINFETMNWVALAGTILWFIATPLWMGRELSVDATEVEI